MSFHGRIPIPGTVAVLLIAVAAVMCLADLVSPAMVLADGQDCFGQACQDQIACGQPAQPQASSGLSGHLLAVPAATAAADLAFATTKPAPIWPPPLPTTWRSVAPFAPRSPPLV